MFKKKWLLSSIHLIIALIAFSFSIFKLNYPIWFAAWIAPVFLIRFIRKSKWIYAVVFSFLVLQISLFIGLIPFMTMTDEISIKMSSWSMLKMQFESGIFLLAPLYFIPFILDKVLYKYLSNSLNSLVFPAGIVAVELLISYLFGTLSTFGESQFTIPPLVITSSILGVFGLSFLVAWFASIINTLWEINWSIRKLGYSGMIYVTIIVIILVYGGTETAFPKKADKNVSIAGITLKNGFFERMASSDLYVSEIFNLGPAEAEKIMSSPQSHLHEMRRKTLKAVKNGARIIVWQEYALTLESSVAGTYLLEMQNMADEEDIYLLVSYARLLNEEEKNDRIMINKGVLFTPDGGIGWQYKKAFPGPGYEEYMVESGPKNIPYIDTPYGRIGQVICADMLFPHYIRQAAVKKIDLLLVPSFDSPFFTPLITFASGYRAVENGFTMIRISGNGHSAIIDPYYRHWAGQNYFEQGTDNFYANVPMVSKKTIYASIGFIFPYIIILLLISLIIVAIIHAAKRDKDSNSEL